MIASEAALSKLLTDNGYRVIRNGWPDLLVVPPDGSPAFAVELKANTDAVQPHQKKMHTALGGGWDQGDCGQKVQEGRYYRS